MACCINTETLYCEYNLCDGSITMPFTATIDGEYRINIKNYSNTSVTATLAVGDAIIVPAECLNEQAEHIISVYDPNGMLVNDTCYKVVTKIYNKCCI